MIKISNRLKSIAKFIDSDDLIADIGCDHALLDIYLIKTKGIKKIIASDIVDTAIEGAKSNVLKYGVSNKIILKLGDGLSTIDKDINTVVISGLGYNKIIKIFEDFNNKNQIKKIIIQSNNKVDIIRKYFNSIGYKIENEELIKDNNIIYTIIVFKVGKEKLNKKEIKLGPKLLKDKQKLFFENLENEIKREKIIYQIMPKKYFIKRFIIKLKINLLENERSH